MSPPPPFIGSNETVLNVEPVSASMGVGDVAADVGFILGVDPQPIGTSFDLDVNLPFVKPLFIQEYEVTFGDERAEDSVDDRLVPELSNRDNVLLQ
jgi:hypothetical protein